MERFFIFVRLKNGDDMVRTILELCSLRVRADLLSGMTAEKAVALAEEAARQGVAGWLMHRLMTDYGGVEGAEVLKSALQKMVLMTFMTNRKNIEIIKHTESLLKGEGIEMVLLKGAALMRDYYPEMSMRAIGDIDVWVRHRDAYRAHDILKKAGYETAHNYRTNVLQESLKTHLDPLYYGGQMIEIHYNLYGPDSKMNVMGEIGDEIVGGRLSDSLMLYHLTTHLVVNRETKGVRVGWVADIVMMMARKGADIKGMIEGAIALNEDCREVMCDVWRRIASMMGEEEQRKIWEATGMEPIAIDTKYLENMNLGFKHGIGTRLRSAWKLSRAIAVSVAEEPTIGHIKDIMHDLKYRNKRE